jgi:uncharacterized damage-inducible protein DinB
VQTSELLMYAYDRVQEGLRRALEGLAAEQLNARVGPDANSIAWLAWHLARVQDDHIAEAADQEQVYTADNWYSRFDLPFEPTETGFGFTSAQVGQVQVASADLLLDYAGAVHGCTIEFLRGLTDDDLDQVVDRRWDPPVTLGVRLISVLSDDLQHVGQAAYVRGLLNGG